MVTRTLTQIEAETSGGAAYKTTEVKTNFLDPINGKRVYRKLVNFGALPNTTAGTTAHGITALDLDGYVRLQGVVRSATTIEDLARSFSFEWLGLYRIYQELIVWG
jgi:hypothetical protein